MGEMVQDSLEVDVAKLYVAFEQKFPDDPRLRFMEIVDGQPMIVQNPALLGEFLDWYSHPVHKSLNAAYRHTEYNEPPLEEMPMDQRIQLYIQDLYDALNGQDRLQS